MLSFGFSDLSHLKDRFPPDVAEQFLKEYRFGRVLFWVTAAAYVFGMAALLGVSRKLLHNEMVRAGHGELLPALVM